VSERGLPLADGAQACPFVAFEDDRDERATVPDHRHRCYAEVRPAPRALAHQEAYCLSSAFPVCPTFQDWARRESARARDARDAAASAAAAEAASAASAGSAAGDADEERRPAESHPEVAAAGLGASAASAASGAASGRLPGGDDDEEVAGAADPDPGQHDDEEPRRNPPRDWSAPPPWLASAEAASRGTPSEPPDFLARRSEPGRGLAGSAADVLAGGSPPSPRPSRLPDPGDRSVDRGHGGDEEDVDFEERDLPRPAPAPRRPRAYDQHLGGPSSGPDWERPRRYEAYPTIKTRIGMPAVPRLVVMAGVLALGALAFFFLPGILGMGAGEPARTSLSPSPSASASVAPTPTPEPTPILYRIKKGDTLLKIATANGITLEELLAANPSIKDPNKISEGQEITIPPPEPEAPEDFGPSAEPSEEPAP
jgi:nucleoid-associated protein YgaU